MNIYTLRCSCGFVGEYTTRTAAQDAMVEHSHGEETEIERVRP